MHAVVDSKLASTSAADPAKLAFEHVERRYGSHAALEGFSLAIAPGEVVCLLGASGSGKTTLLRIASGIETPTRGRVLIDGREVAGPVRFVPPERRNVGLMFQDFALFPHLTIRDNVAFGLRSLPRAEAARLALAGLERVGLARYANAYPHILSGGEQQRVALARALAPRPAVMLMDEPFSGLDVALRDRLQEETLALLKERGGTSLIVTHAPAEAIRMGDRIAVMHAGRIVQAGRAEALYRHPACLLVARLFSAINEVPLTVTGGALRTPAGTFPAPGLADGDSAVLCIRHRAVLIAPAGQGVPGRVLRARFLGDQALMEIAAEGFEHPLTALAPNGAPPGEGAEIGVKVDPHNVLVLPVQAASGE